MKNFNIILSVFLIFCLLISCKKENQEPIDFLRIDTNDKAIQQKELNVLVNFSMFGNDNQYYELDINNDLIADIAFSCSYIRGPVGMYSYGGSSVSALNKNVEFDVEKKNYPIANYSNTYISEGSQNPVTIQRRENFISGNDYPTNLKIDTIQSESPKLHEVGDTLNSACTWKSGCYILTHNDFLYGYQTRNIHTGTWENVDSKFIGFRFNDQNQYYYGWVQINVTGFEYNIRIYRYGLQR